LSDTVKTLGTSTGTLALNWWQLVPDFLGVILIIVNILYILRKIQKTYK